MQLVLAIAVVAVAVAALPGLDGVRGHLGQAQPAWLALAAAAELGGAAQDVLRTRLLLAPDCDWRDAVRAHAEAFAGIEPANTTYYVGALIPEGALVEVELDLLLEAPPR